ncbi:MAG: PEP-CTERM sorting domain-containing protein [Capsulimonadales bacterium]|nr:PEP-CTERM sorting domain-containing protein [Capsulimonadales bacterium]
MFSFSRLVGITLAIVTGMALSSPVFAQTTVGGLTILAPGSVVEGRTIGEWTTEWWQWAFSQSTPNDAFSDTTGANAGVNQSGPVWFVAGTLGTLETRTLFVPTDRYLLIPLINVENSDLEIPGASEADLRQASIDTMNLVDSLNLAINGTTVTNLNSYRELSPAFSFSSAANNPFGVTAGVANTAVADGFWVMLAPIGTGIHTVTFGGGVSSFGFSTGVQATLVAAPEPAPLGLLLAVIGGMGIVVRKRRIG